MFCLCPCILSSTLDVLVAPEAPITDYNTAHSGITRVMMEGALADGTALSRAEVHACMCMHARMHVMMEGALADGTALCRAEARASPIGARLALRRPPAASASSAAAAGPAARFWLLRAFVFLFLQPHPI